MGNTCWTVRDVGTHFVVHSYDSERERHQALTEVVLSGAEYVTVSPCLHTRDEAEALLLRLAEEHGIALDEPSLQSIFRQWYTVDFLHLKVDGRRLLVDEYLM